MGALLVFVRDLPNIVLGAAMMLCVTLAMIGGGGYSLDALLFGHRRVIFPKA
jgi:hypothetical protein